MARTAIPVTDLPFQGKSDGPSLTSADATNDMEFINDGRTYLLFKNDDASPKSVTIVSVADEAGRTQDLSLTVPAGGLSVTSFFRPRWWNQPDGVVHVDLAGDTSLSVGAFRTAE